MTTPRRRKCRKVNEVCIDIKGTADKSRQTHPSRPTYAGADEFVAPSQSAARQLHPIACGHGLT